jgi:hypothetical protein
MDADFGSRKFPAMKKWRSECSLSLDLVVLKQMHGEFDGIRRESDCRVC